jgi:DNA-binding XRE family transcriptional regulator
MPTSLALFDAARAADDGFRIPAAVVNAMLDGEQPVKVWREQRGLTQEALAGKAGISKAYLCQIETRKRVGALKTLKAIADALAVSVNELHDE